MTVNTGSVSTVAGRKYVTTSTAAALMGVHRNTVIAAIRSGRLKASVTPGRHARIDVEVLTEYANGLGINIRDGLDDLTGEYRRQQQYNKAGDVAHLRILLTARSIVGVHLDNKELRLELDNGTVVSVLTSTWIGYQEEING